MYSFCLWDFPCGRLCNHHGYFRAAHLYTGETYYTALYATGVPARDAVLPSNFHLWRARP